MTSHINDDFRRDFRSLSASIQKQARAAYRLFASDPGHPSLRFKKLSPHPDIWSVLINNDYRAIGRRQDDTIMWFFIGSHADYDKLLARLE